MAVRDLDDDVVGRLAAAEEIRLLRVVRPEPLALWVVVVDARAYVRAFLGVRALWHRVARRGEPLAVEVDGEVVDAVFEPVARGALDARVSAAFDAKYGSRSPGPTQALLTPEAVASTLRLGRAA